MGLLSNTPLRGCSVAVSPGSHEDNQSAIRCHLRQDVDLPEQVDLIVIDASFIGIEKLLPAAAAISKRSAAILAMVKPTARA